MATLAIGAIGAGIGVAMGPGTILGMSYAAFGWNVGSLVGGMLFAPKMPDQFGPRLGDLKVQASTYGNPIPRVYGSMRIAGNIIWSTDKIPTAHTQSSGGKGGGGVTQTSYTYSQSFAVALCEGEIVGVRKIWANGKLIYNLSDTADISTIIASNRAATGIRIYTGSESQTADSLIQAYEGAADTPAYRGTAYVVFENLQLADYYNNTPNLEFEVVKTGGSWPTVLETASISNNVKKVSGAVFAAGGNASVLYFWRMDDSFNLLSLTQYAPSDLPYGLGSTQRSTSDGVSFYASNYNDYGHCRVFKMTVDGRVIYGSNSFNSNLPSGIAVSKDKERVFVGTANDNYIYVFDSDCTYITRHAGTTRGYFLMTDSDGYIWAVGSPGSVAKYSYHEYPGTAAYLVTEKVWGVTSAYDFNSRCVILEDSLSRKWFVPAKAVGGEVPIKVELLNADGTVTTYTSSTRSGYVTGEAVIAKHVSGVGEAIYIGTITTGDVGHTLFNLSTLEFEDIQIKDSVGADATVSGDQCTDSTRSVVYSPVAAYSINNISATTYPVSSIVSDLCSQCGLAGGDIDVTDLASDTLTGYMVPTRSTARAAIEPLMQAFFFDAVESDGVVKFTKRGTSSGVSIAQDDLAAHQYGATVPDAVTLDRKQEVELPLEIGVVYMDKDAAYQNGAQYARRLVGASENKRSVQLAMALAASKAKQVADVLMYDAWQGRVTFRFMTTNKYSHLEPTDVIQVTKGGTTYTVRLTGKNEQGGIITFDAVYEDLQVYDQNAAAPSLPAPAETVDSVPLTSLLLLDIPLLRDQDDGYGFYAAACGYGSGWSGCQPFKSLDSGDSWLQFGSGMLNEATIGTASTALGDFTGGNVFDEKNSVTVVLLAGELASDTFTNVLNGTNVALLGDEVIQFREATLTADNTYALTGLLRGRQGTEWAMSTHAVGDRFVLLSSSTTYLMQASNAELGTARKYRGVSLGGFLEDATDIDFTFAANAQECYAPVLLGGGRNAAGDLTLNWVRRTRIAGGWTDYADVPVGEDTEAYEVEIYNGSGYATVLRTITGISAQTTGYTAADQTTDFGAPQATVYWKVYQMSATNGRGYAARGAI